MTAEVCGDVSCDMGLYRSDEYDNNDWSVVWRGREVVVLLDIDEEERPFKFANAHYQGNGFVWAREVSDARLCKSLVSRIKHAAHKVDKFIRHHKKELLIGAAVLAAAVVTVGVIAALSGGAAAGVASSLKEDNEKTKALPAAIPNIPTAVAPMAPHGGVFYRTSMQEVLKQAEFSAKEQRYPWLLHSEEAVRQARENYNAAYDRFKTELFSNIDKIDVVEAGGIVVALGMLSSTVGAWPVASAAFGALAAIDLIEKCSNTIKTLFVPVERAYFDLQWMEENNKLASIVECEKNGYKPELAFHPESPQAGPDKVVFIDKNNPDPNQQILMVLPE